MIDLVSDYILFNGFLNYIIFQHKMRCEGDHEWRVGKDLKGGCHGLFDSTASSYYNW
jgi:hypothetical protein